MPLDADAALKWAIAALTDGRNGRYDTYRRYLDGDQPLAFATEKFKSAFGRTFAEFAYNRTRTVVDAHADRLQVEGFGSDRAELAQAAENLWNANRLDVYEGMIETEAFGMGDAYVIVEKHPERGAVQIWPQRANNVRVAYSEDEPGRIELAVKQWRTNDGYTRVTLYFPDRIEKYRSRTATKGTANVITTLTTNSLEPYQPESDTRWPVPLDVDDTVPVFHFANNAGINEYGQSELHDVLPLQDGLNKTFLDMFVTMEFAAFPQRVLINVDTESDDAADAIRKFQAGIDRLLTLYGSADGAPPSIAEFSAANIEQYIAVIEQIERDISRVSKVPLHYLTQTGSFPSGRALRIAEAPFVAKIEDRQRAFGAVWSDVLRYALRLEGRQVEPGAIRVNWKSAAPLSTEDQIDVALGKRSVGYPLVAILRENGYDPDEIERIMTELAEEGERQALAFNRGLVVPSFGDDDAAGEPIA